MGILLFSHEFILDSLVLKGVHEPSGSRISRIRKACIRVISEIRGFLLGTLLFSHEFHIREQSMQSSFTTKTAFFVATKR